MRHKYKNDIVEAFSWIWGISALALGLYFLAGRNCWAVVCFSVGVPMFRTNLRWARTGCRRQLFDVLLDINSK